VPLDPDKPSTTAVAVVGDRIPATGRPEELTVAAGDQPYTVDTIFADKVVVPGLIAQRDHPFVAALTMMSTTIAIEDRVLSSWEQGIFAVAPTFLPAIAANDRLRPGLEHMAQYCHANGVTAACEPGGVYSKKMRDAESGRAPR